MASKRVGIRKILERVIPEVQSKHRLNREKEIEDALQNSFPDEDFRYIVYVGPFNQQERQVYVYRGENSVVVRMVKMADGWCVAIPKRTGRGGVLLSTISGRN